VSRASPRTGPSRRLVGARRPIRRRQRASSSNNRLQRSRRTVDLPTVEVGLLAEQSKLDLHDSKRPRKILTTTTVNPLQTIKPLRLKLRLSHPNQLERLLHRIPTRSAWQKTSPLLRLEPSEYPSRRPIRSLTIHLAHGSSVSWKPSTMPPSGTKWLLRFGPNFGSFVRSSCLGTIQSPLAHTWVIQRLFARTGKKHWHLCPSALCSTPGSSNAPPSPSTARVAVRSSDTRRRFKDHG